MKIFGFLNNNAKRANDEKIFMMLKSMVKPVSRHFSEPQNTEIRQAYIGGEDFGVHRAGNKHSVPVCHVQRCTGFLPRTYPRRNIRIDTVIPLHTVQHKRA